MLINVLLLQRDCSLNSKEVLSLMPPILEAREVKKAYIMSKVRAATLKAWHLQSKKANS
jgi:hypothetical protein